MYSFHPGAGKRRKNRAVVILSILVAILAIALIALGIVYVRNQGVSQNISQSLLVRARSEASDAQTAILRVTQSSGTNTNTLLATVRSHVYALQCLNALTANIYGVGSQIVDPDTLSECMTLLDQADERMRAGSVISEQVSAVRERVDKLMESLSSAI